jgi:hypothetical protein
MKLIFSTDFRKNLKYQVLTKSVQWEQSCSMRTDGHDEANSRFSQFCERAEKPPSNTTTSVAQQCAVTNELHVSAQTDHQQGLYRNTKWSYKILILHVHIFYCEFSRIVTTDNIYFKSFVRRTETRSSFVTAYCYTINIVVFLWWRLLIA